MVQQFKEQITLVGNPSLVPSTILTPGPGNPMLLASVLTCVYPHTDKHVIKSESLKNKVDWRDGSGIKSTCSKRLIPQVQFWEPT